MNPEILKQCWFLAGPTASGKSSAGICIAKIIGAEIISLDSMAVYQDMDIGTAKPSPEELKDIPHHLINVVAPTDEYSLSVYSIAAEKICEEILQRNHIPLFVGGTVLYLRGIIRGVFEGPSADWEFRDKLEEEANQKGNETIHLQLQKVDPIAANKFHPNDLRRVIRALEVHHLTGVPLSGQQKQDPLSEEECPPNLFWLHPSRKQLYQRVNDRVLQMFKMGLEEEIKSLLTKYGHVGRTARQGLGYKEVIDYLEADISERNLDLTINLIQTRTRQFAKRQHTFFRSIGECKPMMVTGKESAGEVARMYLDLAKR